MAKSIVQKEKCCFVCRTRLNLQKHHIFGGPNRKISDEYGLVVYLCADHHTGQHGVHFDKGFMQDLHELGQMAFEEKYDRATFVQRFGKNYL